MRAVVVAMDVGGDLLLAPWLVREREIERQSVDAEGEPESEPEPAALPEALAA